MILIVDNTQRKMRNEIREALFYESIPCAVTSSDKMDAFLPAGVILLTEAYLEADVREYLSVMHDSSLVTVLDETCDPIDFAKECYNKFCREKCEPSNDINIEFYGDYLTFNGVVTRLTKTEKRIVNMLLLEDRWVSGEMLSIYCVKDASLMCPDPKRIAVHVCNINKKSRTFLGEELITHRRYSGYRIVKNN